MLRSVLGRLAPRIVLGPSGVTLPPSPRGIVPAGTRSAADVKDGTAGGFDESLLEFLVCPLSKKPLRFDAKTNELINEELGIAYPIIEGIPNMIPQEARLLSKDSDPSDPNK